MKRLAKGLWPEMLTPFKEDNTLDILVLRRLTEFYISTGAQGLFANCLSSEMFQLTESERLAVTKTVVDQVGGRIPVISTGSFGTDMNVTATFIHKLYDTGAAAVMISTSQPCNELEKDIAFMHKMETLLEKTNVIPLGVYECPVPYKRLVPLDILKWLAQSGRFLYHKDTSCDLKEIKEKIDVAKNTSMGIYNAHVPTGIDSIMLGARGLSPIAANLYPELFYYLLKNWKDGGKSQEIKKLKNALDLMDTLIHHNYPRSAKLFLQKRGFIITTTSRTPRAPMTPQYLNNLDGVMKIFEKISWELGIDTVNI